MKPHHQDDRLDPETNEEMRPLTRRTLLRRSAIGFTAAALAPLLAACGADGDEAEDAADDAIEEVDDPPDAPNLDPEEPGFDAPDDDADGGTPPSGEDTGG